jgi:hypothetical protein
MKYSFDYDNTLIRYKFLEQDGKVVDAMYTEPHYKNINLLKLIAEAGHQVYIVTSRIKGLVFDKIIDNSPKPEDLVKAMSLPVSDIIYTQGGCKLPYLVEMGIDEHWDDCPEQCDTINSSNLLRANLVWAPENINAFLRKKYEILINQNGGRV